MANKTMHHAVIGPDTFELVDQSARADVSELKNALIVNSASGSIASFLDGGDGFAVRDLKVQMEPIQAGSGDPSPTNIRPISGRTGVTVFHSGSDTSDPTTISVNWETEAGTVYGGTLDVTNGTLTVDRVYEEHSGGFALTTGANNYFAKSVGAYGSVVAGEIISDQYLHVTIALSNNNKGIDIVNSATRNDARILIRPYNMTQQSTADEFNDILAETPLHVCYKVTSPVTVQLTAQQMTTLLGQNNVWSDADSVSVDYVADTKLYIEQLTEPDSDMVADMNIISGRYFMVGNQLFLATANIANGSNIVVGTNCTRTNLAEALNAINA